MTRWSEDDLADAVKGRMFPEADFVALDLPAPVSVNETRRVDWKGQAKLRAWKATADAMVMAAKRRPHPPRFDRIERFQLTVIVSEESGIDLDNGLKATIDYLRRIEVIANDAPRNMRGIHVIFGHAPTGMTVIVRPCE